jgi:AbiV family abortive infection protein
VPQELSEATRQAYDASLAHAKDLLEAAKKLQPSHPHIAYHLAALSLEEVGRSTLLVMEEVSAERSDGSGYRRRTEDHVGKLFWSLWGPTFARERLTGEQIESFRGLARDINETRQRGIYFEVGSGPPKEAISTEECASLIDLAEARGKLARGHGWRRLDDDRAAELNWLMESSGKPEYRGFVFGASSMEKLAELGSVRDWVQWMRAEVEKGERAATEATRAELSRIRPSGAEADEPKWKLDLRFQSASHSIRPKPLTWWNGVSDWIKLYPAGNQKREVRAELTLTKAVAVDGLWYAGLGAANLFLISLNIASRGFFWWELPKHTSQFYDRLTDLERSERLQIQRTPKLEVDWGNQVLTEEILRSTAACFGAIPGPQAREQHAPFDHYLQGLALLAKTDVFLQFEINSFEHFYLALQDASRLYDHWDGQGTFSEHLSGLLAEISAEPFDWSELLERAEAIDAGQRKGLMLDLSHVAAMKIVTDSFLLREFQRVLREDSGGGR